MTLHCATAGWCCRQAKSSPGIDHITVTVDSGGAHAPDSVTFDVGSEKNVFGFHTGETVHLTAEGFDMYDVSQGTTSIVAPVECGPNDIEISITAYAVLLDASPLKLAHDGVTPATITATLRGWNEGDLTEPTGDPVPGKLVEFDASCGTFVGASSGTSDANGEVTVQLVSSEACVAEVHAFVLADLAESNTKYINFSQKMSFWIDGTADDVTGPNVGAFHGSCIMLGFYFRGQLIAERELGESSLWGAYCPYWAELGNVVQLVFTPFSAADYCNDGYPTLAPVYIHTAYEGDYDHQKVYQVTSGTSALTTTLTVPVVLEEIDYYAK